MTVPTISEKPVAAGAAAPRAHAGGEENANLAVALALAGAGIFVFPVKGAPDGGAAKEPCPGVYWKSASTTDASKLRRWWATWPLAAPAIDLGKSGLLVVDGDLPKGDEQSGEEWFLARLAEHAAISIPTVRTGSGGRHWYFQQVEGRPPLGNGRGSLPPRSEVSLDVRGHSGYVVSPGAVLSGGRAYILEGMSIAEAAPVPGWLYNMLASKPAPVAPDAPVTLPAALRSPDRPASNERRAAYVQAALDAEIGALRSAGRGGRNEALNVAAGKLYRHVTGGSISESDLCALLVDACHANGLVRDDGMGSVNATIASAFNFGRTLPPREPDADRGHNGASLAALIVDGRSHEDEPRLVEDASGDVIDRETGEVVAAAADENADRLSVLGPLVDEALEGGYLLPPGLVGEIATWILDTSRRPLGGLAVGAALAVVGTMIGRAVYGPTEAGCHLYIVGLAGTGAGKDHALRACAELLRAGGMEHRIGPGEFTSQSAVISAVTRRPVMLAPLDELGAFLRRINHKRAGGWEQGISKWLRTLWGTSLGGVQTMEYVDRESETIRRPAVTIYGVSTPEDFYGALGDADVLNGFINRWTLFADESTPERDPPRMLSAGVPASIMVGLSRLRELSDGIAVSSRDDHRLEGNAPHKVLAWGPRAKGLYDLARARIEDLDRRGQSIALYARTAEMAVRIATIIAAGRHSDTVDVIDMLCGVSIAVQSANAMADGLRDAGDGSEHGERVRRVSEAIRERGTIKHRDLWRKVYRTMESRHFESVIRALVDAGEVESEGVVGRGRRAPGAVYHWIGGRRG